MSVPVSQNCFDVFDKADEPDTCKCKGIVLNVYKTLRANGVGEREALQMCARVLRYHHPSSAYESKNVVECWVFQNSHTAAH